ncbi:MAG TPA: hypothetical protein IAA61_03960 [Candidatus Ornithomonoglobus merdipullorum]|uniref:Bacterial repeat domain-containing protein n=1 Tax=Candidatus Ornithomonoglobus merdipullorum TaxID=2840895 RepID=A0A9D1MB54_9FIRM|nr:hypothetical protein [Candidatus Ornithomonoglobus merdipullorum]
MKKHNFFKRTVCIAAAAAALFTSAAIPFPAAAAEDDATETIDVSTLPDHIENGDFESPKVVDIVGDLKNPNDTYNDIPIINNPGSNITFRADNPWLVMSEEIYNNATYNEFYWKTTASDKRIEIGTDNVSDANMQSFWGTGNSDNLTAGHNDQFAELVAEEQASLYQNIKTEPGSVLSWSLMHRGRYHSSTDGKDTMALFIGPAQDGLTKAQGTGNNDIFMQLAQLLTLNYSSLEEGMERVQRTLYSKPVHDGDVIDATFVSNNPGGDYTEKWTCWIITDDNDQWNTYSNIYTVPENQTATTFAFTALTGAFNDNVDADYNQGNCLDNITFGKYYPLTVTTTEGGSATVFYKSNGENITATNDNPVYINVEDGSHVSFSVTPDTNYTYVGAYKDGTFVAPDAQHDNNLSVIMDTSHVEHLMFSKNAHVTYDLNGGSINNSTERIEHEYNYYKTNNNAPSTPTIDEGEFLGWRVFSNGKEITSDGNLVPSEHSVKYNATIEGSEEKSTIEISYGNEHSYTIDTDDDSTVMLLAVYSHVIEAQPCTRYIGEISDKHNDNTGGTVTITINNSNDSYGTNLPINYGDTYTVTATPNKGFKFIGWYYENPNTGGLESITTGIENNNGISKHTGTFAFRSNLKIHALFDEIILTPYLSVVAADPTAENELKEAGIDTSHGDVKLFGESNAVYKNNTYGGSKYGNTIATGFFAEREFKLNDNNSIDLSGVWTINIPAHGSYFKMKDVDEIDSNHILEEPVVPCDKAESNPGAIYKAQQGSNNYNRQVKFSVGGTTITGGNAQVTFGIVIDNLYAPNAQAGFRVNGTSSNKLDNSNSVPATTEQPYDQSKLDAIGSTSSTDTQPID